MKPTPTSKPEHKPDPQRRIFLAAMPTAIAIAAILAGCFGGENPTAKIEQQESALTTKTPDPNAPDPVNAGEKILEKILQGVVDNDYPTFAEDFTVEMRRTFPEDGFEDFHKQFMKRYGNFKSRQYLGDLSVGELNVLLWKGRFDKQKNDVLLRLDLGYVDGRYQVFRILIQ